MNPFAHFEDQFGHLQLSDNDAALHVFLAGWNSAMMEMMQRVNKMPFGDDTRASFAVYFQSQMVNVDAIEKPAQQTCNCRWEGEVQVQQCTLHEAHVDAIHEWAERAKSAEHQFKNFHRLLCERFGYTHDERDWRRDQLSLIEWIAKRAEQPAQQEPVCYKHGDEPKRGCAWCDKQPAQDEPVAYRSRWRNTEGQIITGWVAHTDTTENPDPRQEIEPLYTHPQAREPEQPAQQEPAAVVSGYYGGQCVILPIDPARIFNSNTPLYTAPQPCPTCEALARTVMLDQTSHDAQRKPLTITEESAWDLARYVYARSNPHESPQILLSATEIKQIIEAANGITGEKK